MMKQLLGATILGVSVSVCIAGSASAQAPAPVDNAQLQRGAAVYEYWCATCHSGGRGNPGTTALAAKYKDRQPAVSAVLAERTDLTPQSIRFFVRQGVSVMAPFRKTEITDADLDAMLAYLNRNRRRN